MTLSCGHGSLAGRGEDIRTFAYIRSLKSSTCNTRLTIEEDLGQHIFKNPLWVEVLCIGWDLIYRGNEGVLAGRELFGFAR